MTAAGSLAAWTGDDRHARAALSFLADPGDPELGWLLRSTDPAAVLAAVLSGEGDLLRSPPRQPGLGSGADCRAVPGGAAPGGGRAGSLSRAVGRWRARLADLPPPGRLTAWQASGYRLVCPG